jgi:hypothetical protein
MRYNRYKGNCAYCGHLVAARAGYLIGSRGNWKVAHMECHKSGEPQVTSTYFPSTGQTVYQNARGRCIDAPCCGCCS